MELNTARRHASAILAFLQAWDVLRMSQHKETVSGFPSYSLATYGTGVKKKANGQSETKPATTTVPPINGVKPNRTVAPHLSPDKDDALPSAVAIADKVFRPLAYQDKTLVDMENAVEVETFQIFQTAYKREPKNRIELKQFYEKGT
ncbi:MAG: hypothetical protein GY796_01445 [Chloroflexi bacterium]|nr:hypothetical protein [Chloroflexota bacterium]